MPDVWCLCSFKRLDPISVRRCTLFSSRDVSWCVEVCHIRSSQYARYRNSWRSKCTCSAELFLLPAALVARTNARRVRGGCSRDRGKTCRHIRCPSSTCVDEARPECMASTSYPSRVCRPSPGNPILLTCDSIPDAIHVLVVAQRNRIETVVDAKDRNKPETAQKANAATIHGPRGRPVPIFLCQKFAAPYFS